MKKGVLIALLVTVLGLVAAVIFAFIMSATENRSAISQGALDQRALKHITLENGLEVMLVSDPTSKTAAASMTVFAGSWSNLAQPPFVAETLQHLLPLGSEKYPQTDAFTRLVVQGGGQVQTSTQAETTSYAFDIGSQHFEPALDRFAQMFIAPLLDSVHSERIQSTLHNLNLSNRSNEVARLAEVIAINSSVSHPAHRVAQADLPTLSDASFMQSVQQFYRNYYVANNMALALSGPQTLTELEALANSQFSALRNIAIQDQPVRNPMYSVSELPALLQIKPRNNSSLLQFRFPISATHIHADTLPASYIAFLLQAEGQRSLSAELRRRGWINSMNIDAGEITASFTEFVVEFDLTANGIENWQAIGEFLFAKLSFIRNQGQVESVHQQFTRLEQLRFDYAMTAPPLAQVQQLSKNLQYFSPQRALIGERVPTHFDAAATAQLLLPLQPDNVLVVLTHPGAQTDKITPRHKVAYQHQLLGGNTVATWRTAAPADRFSLPQNNAFLPGQTDIIELEREASALIDFHPQRIINTEKTVVWFEQDDVFKTPKVDIHLLIETPMIRENADQFVGASIYSQMVLAALQDVKFAAQQTGADFNVTVTERGILLRTFGFADKLQPLIDTLVVELTEQTINDQLLSRARQAFIEEVSSTRSPAQQAQRHLSQWLLYREFNTTEKIEAANQLSKSKLEAMRQQWLTNSKLTLLIHGNITQQQATSLANRIDGVIPQQGLSEASVSQRIARLPQRSFVSRLNSDLEHGVLLQYFQGNNSSLREQALFELLAHMIRRPLHAEVRDGKLGYATQVQALNLSEHPGIALVIESDQIDAALLTLYANRFYAKYRQQLLTMSDAEFNRFKQGLMLQLQQKETNLHTLSEQYWRSIMIGDANFNSRNRLAHEVKAISQDGFIRFFENQVLGNEVRNLTLHHVPQTQRSDYAEHIRSVVGLFPLDTPQKWPEGVTWITPTFNNLNR